MAKVTIIDYGIGNLLSVRRAMEYFGAEVVYSGSPSEIANSDRLILPGVGAFAKSMDALRQQNLIPAIHEFVSRERPFLGICLGMQMLLESSDEFGEHAGLGLIPGRVVAIPNKGIDHSSHCIPHIGWNALVMSERRPSWSGTLLDGTKNGEYVYFVHSFTAIPKDERHRLADCHYNGLVISAAISRDNVAGCQFHPEKSGDVGLRMMNNFLSF